MFDMFMQKDYLLVIVMSIYVYTMLILNPSWTKLKIKNKKYKACKKCPMKVHPIKFSFLFFIVSSIFYIIIKSPQFKQLLQY